jgi:hypothetical protein
MRSEFLPIIGLDIKGMDAHLQSALGVKGSELGDAISQQIDKAIAEYPFEQKVSLYASQAIDSAISDYFNLYNHGGSQIYTAVFDFLADKIIKDKETI